jgi:2-polyprenyl-3-methyl-5-hydroxy-6-metoxy-1,4-benzoquinol methylase
LVREIGACYLCGAAGVIRITASSDYAFVHCRGCGFRRQDPVPQPGDLEILYHTDFYQDRGLDRGVDELPRLMREIISHRVNYLTRLNGKSGSLIDVGCGTGLFLEAAGRAGWQAVGTETSEVSLAYASKFTSARLFRGELADFPLDAAYDALSFWDVLEHLPDPRGELGRAYALLKPGGIIAISLPNVAGLKARLLGTRWRYYKPSMGHISHFSPHTLRRLLEQAGFRVSRISTHGAFNLWKFLGEDPLSVRESRPLLDGIQRLADGAAAAGRLGETITAWGRRPMPDHG